MKLDWLKQRIEAVGGRAHTEQAAEAAYAQAMESWAGAELSGDAAQALHDLAQSLLGRVV